MGSGGGAGGSAAPQHALQGGMRVSLPVRTVCSQAAGQHSRCAPSHPGASSLTGHAGQPSTPVCPPRAATYTRVGRVHWQLGLDLEVGPVKVCGEKLKDRPGGVCRRLPWAWAAWDIWGCEAVGSMGTPGARLPRPANSTFAVACAHSSLWMDAPRRRAASGG